MDEFDAFYQQLDSEQLLEKHGPELVTQAHEILEKAPDAKIAGMILTPDSKEAKPMRRAIASATGQTVPAGLMVGMCPREAVEQTLVQHVGTDPWREEPGLPQRVLPVVVSTKDGMRFGFFGLDAAGDIDDG